jgi:hypothetical protein
VYATVTDVPRQEYTYIPNDGQQQGRASTFAHRLSGQPIAQVKVPRNVPPFLGNAKIIGYAWFGSMIMIGIDEWKNNGILPRPKRLWGASVVFGGLALVAAVDALVPIACAFAIGYFIMLVWQFYNGEGQFAGESNVKSGV